MPLSAEHKEETRQKILVSAQRLFNRHGFENVSIDMVMENAGLTRGGFYNHFKNKEALFGEAIRHFLKGKQAALISGTGDNSEQQFSKMAKIFVNNYLSSDHLKDTDNQCPMIALPSDVARCSEEVKQTYQELFCGMLWVFEKNFQSDGGHAEVQREARQKAFSLLSMCIGTMVIARTIPDGELANELRESSLDAAQLMMK